MNESGDVGDLRVGQIEFRHATIGTAILDDGGDEFTIFVVEHNLRTNQVGSALAALRGGSVAKAAVHAEQRSCRARSPQGRRADAWDKR